MGEKEIIVSEYTNDAVMTSESKDDFQRLCFKIQHADIDECVTTHRRDPPRCKLAVKGKSIEQVMNFKYLGVHLTSSKGLAKYGETSTCLSRARQEYTRPV